MRFFKKILDRILNRLASVLLPSIRKIIKEELTYHSHDLKYKMQDMAANKTADFIVKNIPINLHFNDRYSLLHNVCSKLKKNENDTDGSVLEFGVWKGSTINHMSKLLPKMNLYGFDSFEGLTEPWIFNNKGAFDNISELPKVEKNVELIQGYFNDTLPHFMSNLKEQVKLVHIDCDLYSSTVTIFENIQSVLKPGVIIVFDEFFNYPGWENGEYKAWNEFVEKNNISYEYIGYSYQKNEQYKSGQQVAVLLK